MFPQVIHRDPYQVPLLPGTDVSTGPFITWYSYCYIHRFNVPTEGPNLMNSEHNPLGRKERVNDRNESTTEELLEQTTADRTRPASRLENDTFAWNHETVRENDQQVRPLQPYAGVVGR